MTNSNSANSDLIHTLPFILRYDMFDQPITIGRSTDTYVSSSPPLINASKYPDFNIGI